jgi:hypothetical protein
MEEDNLIDRIIKQGDIDKKRANQWKDSISHDITHCAGQGCTKKDTCHRYLMHLDAIEKDLGWLSYGSAQVCIDNDYNNYWERRK